ncbi:MAG TPA: hypothetical protein VG435_01520 [Acidimicrobiales bacterium]|nr:hypothetical protein [Acidimicrobiales bacterium]
MRSDAGSGKRPDIGMDIRPKLLADALGRSLGQQGWPVFDVREQRDRPVDILLLSDQTDHAVVPGGEALVIVLPCPENPVGSVRYQDGTERCFDGGTSHLDQLLALLESRVPSPSSPAGTRPTE